MARIQAVIGIIKDCNLEKMEDVELIEETLGKSAKLMGLTLLKTISHKFTPQGLTAITLLAESHIAIHTYPDENSIFVEVMSCGHGDAKRIPEYIGDALDGVTEVVMDKIIGDEQQW